MIESSGPGPTASFLGRTRSGHLGRLELGPGRVAELPPSIRRTPRCLFFRYTVPVVLIRAGSSMLDPPLSPARSLLTDMAESSSIR